jgi:hypothetical protein
VAVGCDIDSSLAVYGDLSSSTAVGTIISIQAVILGECFVNVVGLEA